MMFEDIPRKERLIIGTIVSNLRSEWISLRKELFIVDPDTGDSIDEKIESAQDLFDIFSLWVHGANISLIADTSQCSEDNIKQIFELVGLPSPK